VKVTLIVTAWRRFDQLHAVLDAWEREPEVGEIILWDNSQGDMPSDVLAGLEERVEKRGLWLIRSSRNFGSSARYALASLAAHEVLLFADDDVMPHAGLTAQLLAHYQPERMVGVKGRLFHGAYHGNTEVRSENLGDGAEPVEVDMLVGHIMLTHRDWLIPYSFAGAAWYCCELELQGRIMQDVREGRRAGPFRMFVIPTTAHHDLPEQTDHNALYRQVGADAEKMGVYERLFRGHCLGDS